MGYIRFPITTSPDVLAKDVFDFIQGVFPDWDSNTNNLDVWIIRAIVAKAAENRDLASDVQDDIFRYFGANLMGIPPLTGVAAVASTTWTMIDTAGHTIPANTTVAIRDASGQSFVFLTVNSIVVPAGSISTGAGDVLIRALNVGADANNLGGVGVQIELIDTLDFVDTVVMTGVTAGGTDDETDEIYLPRLVRRLRRLSQRPIVAPDFAEAALDVSTEVERAVELDTYDSTLGTYGHDRHVTISAVNAVGQPVSVAAKTALQDFFNANREQNFVVHVMDANYTSIDVHADVEIVSGFDAASVLADTVAAIIDYLQPYNWGRDPLVTDITAQQTWVETDTLYYNELIALVSGVEGVNRVVDLTVNKTGTAAARVDVALTAPAALTTPNIPNITATAV
jgi:hypothetical protein